MLTFLLCAQIAASSQIADSTYSSPALKELVAAASVANRRAPEALRSYTSRIETEASLIIRDTLGREHSGEVEQMAAAASWERGGRYDLHIVGYRSQSVGVPYSTLSIVRGWTVPSLYGERLSFGAYFNNSRRGATGRDTLVTVHPFARDRELYYRFTGGDTVAVLRAGERSIPIVRIRVSPNFQDERRLGAFDGEIDLDANRKQIVRMRGQVVTLGKPSLSTRVIRTTLSATAAAYIEFVNAEIDGKYWLPAFQRTEFQAQFAVFGQTRPVFRLVSKIRDIVVNESGAIAEEAPERRTINISWAPRDSVDRFDAWDAPIGVQTSEVHADDFDDLAPDRWRTTGPARLEMFPNSMSRIVRYNRVEGLFLGLAPSVDFRSAIPGLTMGAYGGWAFTEKTIRGGAYANYRLRSTTYGLRAERALASTNDFAMPLSDDPGLGALLGSIDNYDYVDRSTALLSATKVFRSVNTGLLTTQFGVGRDRAEISRLTKGLFGAGSFRPNRGVIEGSYVIGMADLEIHPNVTGDFVSPGFGGRMHYEVANGGLSWQRTDISLSARKYVGPVSFALHADGGILSGAQLPPQKLYELGGNELLPGYSYKQFAGNRAALFRSFASYRFNVLKQPWRLRRYYLPGLSPGIGASIQGGWTELSSPAARASATLLGLKADGTPLSTATDGVRATAGGGLTFFSDLLHVGAARPIDRSGKWKFVLGFGTAF
jgi:hypothetical protein